MLKFLFWVAISVLQLDEVSLYAAGLALLEQNLHTLDNMGLFDKKVIQDVLEATTAEYCDVFVICCTCDHDLCSSLFLVGHVFCDSVYAVFW